MKKRLAIPIFYKDKVYTYYESDSIDGGTLAETNKAAKGGDYFSALRIFIIGCIKSFETDDGQTISDPIAIKSLVSKMPYRSAELISLELIIDYNEGEDEIEGVYECPRCYKKILCEYKETDGLVVDSRDSVGALPIKYCDDTEDGFKIELEKPVTFYNDTTKEILEEVRSIIFRYPNLEDGINAYARYGGKDEVRLQYDIYLRAITHVNNETVDMKWKNVVGSLLFDRMKANKGSLGKITAKVKEYGINPYVKKVCVECGKEWEAYINTSNFFVSVLRSVS